MPNPMTLGYSPMTSRIYAGRSKPFEGAVKGARVFTGEKTDVTDDAMNAVTDKLLKDGKPVKWILADGRILTLSAVITEPEQAA